MVHIKTTAGKKRFVCKVVKNSKSAKRTNKIYRAVEKAINYKPRKTRAKKYKLRSKNYRKYKR